MKTTEDCLTDIKIDLAEGCEAVLNLLGKQLDNGNCNSIVRVDIGYFHHSDEHGTAGLRTGPRSRLSDDELLLVFQGVVCCLPVIKTLVCMSYFRADAMSLPVGALEMLFRRANRLEILFLHQIQLTGNELEFRIMARSLSRHPALKRVNLHCCDGSDLDNFQVNNNNNNNNGDTDSNHLNLDPLVCGLARLPTMYYLSLDQVPISNMAVEALANSQSLKDISFYNMPQLKASLPILFQRLGQRHCKLRGLRIRSCQLNQEEAVSISKMLETNTSLESLVFYVNQWEDYGTPLAFALAQNTTLKRLEVGIGRSPETTTSTSNARSHSNNGHTAHPGLDRRSRESTAAAATAAAHVTLNPHTSSATLLCQALEANNRSALCHLCLCLNQAKGEHLYEAYMDPLERMLETNYKLEHLLLQGYDSFSLVSPKVDFLLRLNQRSVLDRSRFFQDVVEQEQSHKPWVESMVRHNNDLSILYYLLGKNPNLVSSMVAVES